MTTPENQPAAASDDQGLHAPRPLDYPSPAPSSFDPPMDQVVRLARGVSLAVRIALIVAAVGALVVGVWSFLR